MWMNLICLGMLALSGACLGGPAGNATGRAKRTAFDSNNEWLPAAGFGSKTDFTYCLEGINSLQQYIIETALNEINDKTCLQFEEVDDVEDSDVKFTTLGNQGCSSFRGDDPSVPFGQPIFLTNFDCFRSVGTVLRQIVIMLGMGLEVQRSDRDTFVEDIAPLPPMINSLSFSERYDFQSITHDPAFAADGEFRIETMPPYFESTIGQESELSFLDAKAISRQFCGTCDKDEDCQNGGYSPIVPLGGIGEECEDPSDFPCVCPDFFEGEFCEEFSDEQDGECDPDDDNDLTATSEVQCLEVDEFEPGDSCNWIIRNPQPNCLVKLWFDEMEIPGQSIFPLQCNNWVEVRMCDWETQGQRFCAGQDKFIDLNEVRQTDGFSAEERIVVTFRSFLDVATAHPEGCLCSSSSSSSYSTSLEFEGFKLCFQRVCGQSLPAPGFCAPPNFFDLN